MASKPAKKEEEEKKKDKPAASTVAAVAISADDPRIVGATSKWYSKNMDGDDCSKCLSEFGCYTARTRCEWHMKGKSADR
jgi:hypothetical protein